jgi:hypothetical protein
VSMPLADGPAMYFGGTIMTFALPLGAFIVISVALFYLFRSAHSGPRLKYPTTGSFSSVGTREPGPAPAPAVVAAGQDTTAAEAEAVVVSQVVLAPEAAEPEATVAPEETAAPETTDGKVGGE